MTPSHPEKPSLTVPSFGVIVPVGGGSSGCEGGGSVMTKRCCQADDWNARYPVGTRVRYFPIAGEPAYEETCTRSKAWQLGSGHSVVKVEGRAGGVSLRHLEPFDTLKERNG